jgi:hypothetical protein
MVVGQGSATILIGPVTNPANGHKYALLSTQSWTASQAEAIALGCNLVTINDAAENTWVYEAFDGDIRNLWIGYTDQDVEGTWTWADGSSSLFTNWHPIEPDNFGDQDYGFLLAGNYASPNPATYPPPYAYLWGDIHDVLAAGSLPMHGVIESASCRPDVAPQPMGNDHVDVDDLIAVILGWGACPDPPAPCGPDVDQSGAVDVDDLIAVILAWGSCP